MEYPQRTLLKTFVSYSHDDDDLLDALQKHFALLKRHRAVELWTDRGIVAGTEWNASIHEELEAADLILLLISASFLASDFCYNIEMRRALERHDEGSAQVVPIILRPCDWMESPFAKLQALPSRAKPITSWDDPDTAMTDVAKGIRQLLNSWSASQAPKKNAPENETDQEPPLLDGRYKLLRQIGGWAAGSVAEFSPDKEPKVAQLDSKTERLARLSEELRQAYQQRASLESAQLDTAAINQRILDLKRRQRQGPQLQPGEFLGDGRFQLVRTIGQGGFATVWEAHDSTMGGKVAVKVLHGQFSASEERRERLFRGARQMAKLDHPCIVKVLTEPTTEDGWAYFVMEYLEGGDFRRAVLDGHLDVEQRLDVLEKVALAIDHAHGQKVVHRDIKPANILLDADGSPKLTDFDLVLAEDSTGLTRTKAGMGSYHYAAPESMDDAAGATARCDVYSLAASLVFALQGQELSSLFLIQREAYLAKLGVAVEALGVLRRGLHWDVKERFGSTVELVRSLRAAMRPISGASFEATSSEVEETPKAEPRRIRSRGASLDDLFRVVETCDGIVPLWCEIPAGEGWLGSPDDEEGRHSDEGPRHRIQVVRPFWMAAVPVTNAQYAAFDENRASLSLPNLPVVEISWKEALEFCQWLEEERGFRGARLPTEEEWEYACRAGNSTRYWSGDARADLNRVGWFVGNSGSEVHAVGEKPANPWGLYDLHGNVWEWTASRWKDDYSRQANGLTVDPEQPPADLAEPAPRAARVFRGGGYIGSARGARSAGRVNGNPTDRFRSLGFRVLLPFPPNVLLPFPPKR